MVVWFAAIAVAVAGPLLGPGYLLLLDFPAGPEFPRVPAGPNELDNTLPLLVVHSGLGAIHSYLPDKVFLLAPVLVGGTGMARLTRSLLEARRGAAVYAGTLYVLNPFVLDRLLAGHLYFLLGYSLLPWALPTLWRLDTRSAARGGVFAGVWLAVLAAVSVHVAGAYALLAAGAISTARTGVRGRIVEAAGMVSVAAVLSAYWLVPAIDDSPQKALQGDIETFASRPGGVAVLPRLVALEGFWRDEFPHATSQAPVLYLLVLPMVGLAAVGGAILFRECRRLSLALCLVAVLGVVLAASSALAPAAARRLVDHVPALGAYREPQKLLLLTVVAYALLGAAGLGAVTRRAPRLTAAVVTVVALSCTATYAHRQLWGLGGRVELARYPTSWHRAERAMAARGDGAVLVLPWRLYAVWTFTDGRIVANPARSFFPRRVLAPEGEPGRDSTPHAVDDALARLDEVRSFGALLVPQRVRYVAWMHEADWWRYRALRRQRDLVPIFRDAQLTVFENRAVRPGST